MTFNRTALLGAILAGTAVTGGVPASAQQQQQQQIKLSPQASKAIVELQTAVKANDFANVPAKAAAANAAARTPDDRYAIAQLQLQAAVAQKNDAATASAIEAMLATGRTPAANAGNLRINLAKLKYSAKDYAGASAALEQLIAAEPNNTEAMILLGESRNSQGRPAEAVPLFQKAIAARAASGQAVPKEWRRRAIALAYNNKLPNVQTMLVDWVRADPTADNIRDAARIHAELNQISTADQVDLYRLQRAAGSLKGESDFYKYANAVLVKGFPGEAKAVLDEGFASGAINKSSVVFRDVYTSASSKAVGDRAALASTERSGLAATNARQAVLAGDVFYGYGDYAKAAALYRAALGKSGADKDLTNLRLGMALGRAGDKAGANSALQAVGGTQQGTAQLWQAWLASR